MLPRKLAAKAAEESIGTVQACPLIQPLSCEAVVGIHHINGVRCEPRPT